MLIPKQERGRGNVEKSRDKEVSHPMVGHAHEVFVSMKYISKVQFANEMYFCVDTADERMRSQGF